MAIIITGKTRCSICAEVLGEGQELYATTAFLSSEHPLWRFSDSGMHWDCFETWEHREDFVHALISAVTAPNREWGYDLPFVGEYCSVVVNVVLPESIRGETTIFEHRRATPRENPRIRVWLRHTGTSFDLTLNEWDAWLKEERWFTRVFCDKAWQGALKELRNISSQELFSLVDVDSVICAWNERAERQSTIDGKRYAKKAASIVEHNESFHGIIVGEPHCPHCGQKFQSLKYYDNRGNDRKSCVICQDCARSSRLDEFLDNGHSHLK